MFIALEGGEGSGKTTATKAIIQWLQSQGHDVVATREPGGTPNAETIRTMLVQQNDYSAMVQTLLFAAARADHVERLIKPALAQGQIVLTDRYVLSTLAYQGAAGSIPTEAIISIHEQSTGSLYPDLTLVLDIDPEIGLKRSFKRLGSENSAENHFENQEMDFHRKIRAAMLDAAKDPNVLIIDASRTSDEVIKDAIAAISDRLTRHLEGKQG